MSTDEKRHPVRVVHPTVKVKNKNIDLSPYVRVIETYKNLKQPAGTFFIELSPRSSKDNITSYNLSEKLYNDIDPMDIIEIGITGPGLMVGLIDSPNKTKSIGMEHYSRSLQITGRDFAKLLIEDSIVYSPQLTINKNAVQILGEQRLAFIGQLMRGRSSQVFNNPICAVLFILKNIPAVQIEIPFTDLSNADLKTQVSSGRLGDYFICDLKAFLRDRVADTIMSQYSGKIWNYLMLCIDENFYELYVDTVLVEGASQKEARPCLFLRPKPFDRTTDNVVMIKDVYSTAAPALQAAEAVLSLVTGAIAADETGKAKAMAAGKKIMQNLIKFNKVIYPRPELEDISFTKKSGGGPVNPTGGTGGGGSSEQTTTYVSIAEMDQDGNIPEPPPPRFKGERDVNNPHDTTNKSMVIPWTWDGNDSFYRTMVTNEQFHVIHDEDIMQESLGTADYEVIDYITVRSRKDMDQDPAKAMSGYSYPLLDAYKIRRFGLRALNAESNLLQTSFKLRASEAKNYRISSPEKKDIFSSTEYVNNRERLFNWYRYNDILESGILVIKGNQDIRIGDKIFMPDAISKGGHKGIYAYVQGVKNRYEYTPTGVKFETTLEIIRGENPEDINEYRSQVNTLSGSELKLGTTYRNYDEALGQMYTGSASAPGAHNIIKYDVVSSIDELDAEKGRLQKPENEPPDKGKYSTELINSSLQPKFSGYISPSAEISRQKLLQMQGEGKPFSNFPGHVITQMDKGRGTNARGQGINIDPKVFLLLEAIGSIGFPFKITVKDIIKSSEYNIENNPKMQVAPHSLGKSVFIAPEGSGNDYVKRASVLAAYLLGLKPTDDYISDNRLKSLLDSRGVIPRIVIACPNQDNAKDIKLCKGVGVITDRMKTEHKDRIQVIF